jgi:hypothetical protein
METEVVSPLTAHRSLADCPFSMVPGSASNCVMVGFTAGATGAACRGGGGGGVATGAFFLHPAADIASAQARTAIQAVLDLLIVFSLSIVRLLILLKSPIERGN